MLQILLFIVILFLIINFVNIEAIRESYHEHGVKGVIKFMVAFTVHTLTFWARWWS